MEGLGEDFAERYSEGEIEREEREDLSCWCPIAMLIVPSASLPLKPPGKKGVDAGLRAALLAMVEVVR